MESDGEYRIQGGREEIENGMRDENKESEGEEKMIIQRQRGGERRIITRKSKVDK